jgi:Ca-activated chloride channel family protein
MGISGTSLLIVIGAILGTLALAAAAGLQGDPAPPPNVPEGSPVTVRFVEPRAPGLIHGVTRVTVEASTSPDAHIVSVSIYADRSLISTMESPPYTLTWNAGTRFIKRVLSVVALDSLGRTGEAKLVTRPLRIGQYEEVRLVNVFATVRDRKGRPVLDLGREDFTLREDGAPQNLSHFTSAKVPLTVALLIDASNSMNLGGKLRLARRAAEKFAAAVDPEDRLLVLHFNDGLHGRQEPISIHKDVEAAIDGITAEGGTALYDAIFRTAALITGSEGRRAIVLLSDGRDQSLTENEPGSLHLFEEALRKAHQSEAAIYAIGLGRHLESEFDLQHVRSLKEILETFARETGGRAYFPARAGQLSHIYAEVASDLKQQYGLGYTSTNVARDGKWRAITLEVKPPGLDVQARSGYYAPGPALP